jgi:PAS domain S-box-containing protein
VVSSKKEVLFKEVYELIPDALVICSLSGRIIDCNQTTVRQFGLKSKYELIGTVIYEWIAERDRSRAAESPTLGLTEGGKKAVEYPFLRVDGTEYSAELSVILITDETGKPTSKVAIIRDIGDRKVMEQELEETRETIRALLNAPPDTAYLIDKFGRVYAANETGARVLGKRANDLVGLNYFRLLPVDLSRARRDQVNEVFQNGLPLRFEDQLGRRFYEITVYPVYGQRRKVTRVALFARDITERKEMEEELERYSAHLQELVEEKTKQLRDVERLAAIGETATMVGHDLRNPLQVIINTVFLAKTEVEEAPEDLRKKLDEYSIPGMFDSINKQVDYMNKIVSDLQDFARDMSPRIVRSDLNDLIKDSIPSSTPANITINKQASIDSAFFDPYMMRRVMTNLITNAIQAMPDGGELTLRAFSEGDHTFIQVKDTGVGIPEEFKPKLFKPLSTTKSIGTGMGLAVVKRFVAAHNGTIDVESEVGKGTTFIIKLPAVPMQENAAKSVSA